MEQPQAEEIKFLSFAWLCLKEALRTSTDKADWIVLIVGAALGPVALFVPRWEIQVTHLLLIAPISALSSVIIFRVFLSPLLVYRKRNADARNMEQTLRTTLVEREKTILKLTAKTRTAAEQHHYDIAKQALQKLGPDAPIALRHLKTQRRITFGAYPPPFLPSGISPSRLVDIYRECAREGLVAGHDDSLKGERTFEIAPTMNAVLDELLYKDGAD